MAALPLVPLPAAAQDAPESCPQGRISRIFIDNHSVFDVDELGEDVPWSWAYRVVNALHIRTRASFIRDELLFQTGDCYDPFLLEDSGRLLRAHPFLAHADVYAVTPEEGEHHVVVDTRDEWTTQVDLGVSFDDGIRFEALEITEENFLGRGVLLEGFFRERRERKDLGVRLASPRLLGTRLDGSLEVGSTRAGNLVVQSLEYPFVGEAGRVAMRQLYLRRDEVFPYSLEGAEVEPYTHLALPFRDERAELSVGARLGQPGNLTLLGMALTRETLEYDGFPGSVEAVRDNDFGAGEPAPDGLRSPLALQARPASTTRLHFLLGQRNLRFLQERGLDALDGEQDLQLGTDLGLTLGRSVDVLTASGIEASDDLYTRLRFFAGADPGTSFVFLNLALQARQIVSDPRGEDGWRDVLAEGDLYGYIRSRRFPRQTFFARISGAGGWQMRTPFQLTLGGRSSVRGYGLEDFPGGRRVLATLEDRIFLDWPAPELLDAGLTAFVDVGRVWPGDVPYGVDSGWRVAVGGGLRLGFPAGSRGVARVDLAFPLTREEGHGPVLRITLYEVLGLTTGFFDPQMERSRRVTVGPDSFTRDRR